MRRVIANSFIVFGSLVWVVSSDAKEQAQGPGPFSLLQQEPNGWEFEYMPAIAPTATIELDGVPHQLFVGGGAGFDEEPGKPQLPVEALSLGVPDGCELRVEVVNPIYTEVLNQLVAPNPVYTYTQEKEAVPHYARNATFYSQNRFFPSQTVLVDRPFAIRQQRVSTIRIAPCQYNPVTKVLKQLVKATLSIRMVPLTDRPLDLSPTSSSPDPQFEHMYKGLILNYDQAKQWRQPITSMQKDSHLDPTRDWFETGRTYYRILIANDGWYKVTKDDLTAAGANTSQIDLPTLRIFGKGEQIPLMIRPDTTIEFYAMMNYGDSTYVDEFNDTNTYFLTWGGTVQGLRFTTVVQPAGPPGQNIVSAKVTRHVEQNNWYYAGATQADVEETELVPGEGWAWGQPPEWFIPGAQRTYSFVSNAIDRSVTTSGIRVRMFGTNESSPPTSHRAAFSINDGSLFGDITFPQRSEGFLSTLFPTASLSSDSSTLTISSIPTGSGPNQFYLDWFEIDYWRYLRSRNDQLFFTSPMSSGSSPVLFTVSGFSSTQIDVFELTGHRKITGGTVTGDSVDPGSGYSIAFRDTFSTAKEYLVVCTGGPRSVLPLSPKIFSDLRVNTIGSDYMIISHKLFMAAAQHLGAHRQAVNNVRVKVVDVQDIYDEFNYGVFNGEVIKNFLRYAYLQWPTPALTYVLFFGDACWDYKRYISSTTQINYVPSHGHPVGDNWFGCFNPDTSFIPSLLIGRLPVKDSVQAQHAVAKIIGYDSYALGDWNKSFMFITGGITPSEQISFNYSANFSINTYVSPPPIGGTPYRVYKNTLSVIDGENKQLMRNLVRDGLVYVNFLGHSGGRYWGVDIGDPNTLENTNGRLPFLSSVSCNVGAFAEPSATMLAEDFAMADDRGSIASWASSALGYASTGAALNQFFLDGITNGVRDLGSLTTTARFRLWQTYGDLWVKMVKLNPLLGDPLTRIAIPLQPDLAMTPQDISLNTSIPTPNDSMFIIRAAIHNYGLVPLDSVGVTVTDTYNGQSTPIVSNKRIPRTLHRDTLSVSWDGAEMVGRHTLTVSLDPMNGIPETNETNNTASVDQYVYANLLSVVKPLNNMAVSPGPQVLTVTSPLGLDSVGFQYFFELDTVATFDSPFRTISGPVVPGPVSGEWTTPSLANNTVYFWRARTMDGTREGNWVVSSFVTSLALPAFPLVRVREYSARQFVRERLIQAAVTDSGVTITPNAPLNLAALSHGSRAHGPFSYCTFKLNEITVTGYTYILGYSLMALRVSEFDGSYEVGGGNGSTPWHPDSMLNFIRNTPVGNYVAIVSLVDVSATLNESLYVAIEALGSARVREVQPGQSWAFIGRKGYPGSALESLTNDSAIVNLQIPNYYSLGFGSITTTGISSPTSWDSFHWRHISAPPSTAVRVALLGVKPSGVADTLRFLSGDSTDVSLAFLNPLMSGPTYTSFRSAALLSAQDASFTPVLKDWWVDFTPPADLAVSSRTVGALDLTIQKGVQLNLPVTVYNIGFRGVDSARVVVSVYDKFNKARPIATAMLDTIAVNGTKSTTIPISTTNFSRRVTLQVNVSPSKKYKDLVPDNNNAYYTFNVVGMGSSGIQLFADGVQLMDGDFVAARPTLVVRLTKQEEGTRRIEFLVDSKPINPPAVSATDDYQASVQSSDELTFMPQLSNGRHELKVRSIGVNSLGSLDTLEQTVDVDVDGQMGIVKLYNYPNPFSKDTYFTFVITGGSRPEELHIRIFTIAGRRVQEIVVPQSELVVGFNRVYWDGRDADGDELGNGYYFYKVTIKGQGQTESSIQKLAKIR
jgi:hypothetical protein